MSFLTVGRSKRKSRYNAMDDCRQEVRTAYAVLPFGLKAE